MTPDEYCQEKTASSKSSFYYSFLFLTDEKRKAITALYAFCREVDDVVDECKDTNIARTKLQWWRDEIERLYNDNPQHPVTRALAQYKGVFSLSKEYFHEIINGMEMDLEHSTYPTFEELKLYCYRVASAVGLLVVPILGYQDPRTLKYAKDLGIAFQLTNILRDVREDATRGRIYMPLDELNRFSVTPEDIFQNRSTNNTTDLFRFQAQRAHEYYNQAFAELPDVDRYQQRIGLIMAAVYLATLKEIEKRNFHILEQRISLPMSKKLWIAWNAARKEKLRFHKMKSVSV